MLRAAAVVFMFLDLPLVPVLAHAVPGIVVEAEFSPAGEGIFLVDLDPRLFLGVEPEKTPPLPSAWWFDQDESARVKTLAAAVTYINALLRFQLDGVAVPAGWKVQAVDSNSLVPLSPASAEVHLVAEHRAQMPATAKAFSVTLSKECPVSVMVVCSVQDSDKRVPQLILPGETSHPFAIPGRQSPRSAQQAVLVPAHNAPAGIASRWPQLAVEGHSLKAHVLFAFLLACAMAGRFWSAAIFLIIFHAAGLLGASFTWAGWLPVKPGGMPRNCWMLLGGVCLATVIARRNPPALLALGLLAGFTHGWSPWNQATWQALALPMASVFRREGLLVSAELGVLLISVLWLRSIRNFLPRRLSPED